MTTTTPTFKAGQAWLVTIIAILGSIGMALSTYKAMTTVVYMMTIFQMDIATYGSVTSVIGCLAIFGSIPAGAMLAKLGPKRLMIICLAAGALSAYLQIFTCSMFAADGNFMAWMWMGCLGCFFFGMWTVNGPLLSTAWFPNEKRGLPNSISTAWVSLAMMLLLTISAPLIAMGGDDPYAFLNVWWLIALWNTATLVLTIFLVKMPNPENSFMVVTEGGAKGKISDGFKNPGAWMLIVIFLGYGFLTAGYGNYFPTYLKTDPVMLMDETSANLMSSVCSYVMLIMNFAYGPVLNKIPNKKYGTLIIVICVLQIIVGAVMFVLPNNSGVIIAFLVVYGIVSQMYPPVCFAALPEMCDSQEEMSSCMGVIAIFSNISGILATAVLANLVTADMSYAPLIWPNIILCVLALVCAFPLLKIYAKGYAKHHAEELAA